MKKISLIACLIISIVMVQYRVMNSDMVAGKPPLKVTVWDAFGYYMYLPSICLYHDVKELKWVADIDKKYSVSGGDGIQAMKTDKGYTFKYLGGVAILETPFFLLGHFIAKHSHYPPDGFSPPYQYALGFGVIFYCILAIFLLRKLLLLYFSDLATSITLLLVCLATNFIQYAAVDNGQSHGYIFPLYVLIVYTTLKWHQQPRMVWAVLTGYIIGLAMICRPTEGIMLFIPLLWNTHNKEAARQKWQMVKQYKSQVMMAVLAGFIGVLPQLIYWKITTGSYIFDVGSKWEFLNPHFRVLFGWEKGWFIYTPVTIFFIAGMFFIKQFPFRKSVLWFCLLNIYIIIAWHDWRYGGSYSTRALMQSYPLFAFPMAALVERVNAKKWRWGFYLLGLYLVLVNLFQLNQYNTTVLHFNDMNRLYYGRIYLNPNPSPVDMSLLDNDEILRDESGYNKKIVARTDSVFRVYGNGSTSAPVLQTFLDASAAKYVNQSWLKVEADIYSTGFWQCYLNAEIKVGDTVKNTRIRLFNAISPDGATNKYAFYIRMPEFKHEPSFFNRSQFRLFITSPFEIKATIHKVTVTEFDK